MTLNGDPRVDSWLKRIVIADEHFKQWESKFQCRLLDNYYEGRQWPQDVLVNPGQYYILNLIYSTWKTKAPSLIFKNPQFNFSPVPKNERWDPETAWSASTTASDLVNTLVNKRGVKFSKNCAMALLDCGPYYGVVEVGYSRDWKQNPNIPKPVINKDYDEDVVKVKEIKSQASPEYEEQIYVRRIPGHRFRVGGNDSWDLDDYNWSGYYMWIRRIDLVKFGEKYQTGEAIDEYISDNDQEHAGLCKVWKLFDHRKKVSFLLNQTDEEILSEELSFNRLPLFPLIFDARRKGFYPMPLFYNWKPSQDDYNEARDQLRAHRRRSKRAYQSTSALEEEEKQKLVNGPDGIIINVDRENAIQPIHNSSADSSIVQTMQLAKDDFNIVSQTSTEARGQADRVTATQASITNKYSEIRNEYDAELVAEWLSEIGREILLQAVEKFTLPVFIKESIGVQPQAESVQIIDRNYKLITMDVLENYDYEAIVDVTTLSPIKNQQAKNELMEFLAVINQYPILSLSPTLIRAIAQRFNFRDEKVVKEMQMMSVLKMQSQLANAPQLPDEAPTNMSQRTVEQVTPPTQAEIENQLAGQGVPQ
jgi:hypothetical protein